MKLAQYEVLGNDVKEIFVPAGTIETFGSSSLLYGFASATSQSIVPSGTDLPFNTEPSTSYWASSSPSGTTSLDAHFFRLCRCA
jgi:hypothetical protein